MDFFTGDPLLPEVGQPFTRYGLWTMQWKNVQKNVNCAKKSAPLVE